jgi:dihydroorotate dehydrogenase
MSLPIFGRKLNTPLAISAGLDKHAEAIDALYDLSPAISLLEVGCITPEPQPGNEKPRMFRLPTSESLINRYGFNSQGADAAVRRLRERVRRYALANGMTEEEVLASDVPASLREGRLLAIQIGKNKNTSETDIEGVKRDYVTCVDKLGRYADVLVVNVSSPNTPGLRDLQRGEVLQELLGAITTAAKQAPRKWSPQVMVKVSPDLGSYREVQEIAEAVKASGVAGVIVSNTTTVRPPQVLASPQTSEEERRIFHQEKGGLSGPILLTRTKQLVRAFRRELGDSKAIFASGGITKGEDAVDVMHEGADMVMAYTGMVYGGVGFFGRIAREMQREYESRKGSSVKTLN